MGKLYNLEEESGIAKIELIDLDNWKDVVNKEEKEEISKMQEIKEKTRNICIPE